ncbi:MAG: FAD-dependent oxidoreductase [Pseudonocardiaceae bacterium]
MTVSPTSRTTVVVVGGGYGGVNTAKALDDIADVVLVEPKEAFQHNVAALRALVDLDFAPTTFLPYDRLLSRGRVVREPAVSVAPGRVTLGSGTELAADYIVLATGSRYPFPAKSDHTSVAEALKAYRVAHEALAAADRVLLLGAGPVGIELAGEISNAWPGKHITLLDAGPDLLPGDYNPALRVELARQLAERGIELVLGSPLAADPPTAPGELAPIEVRTTDGRELRADLWLRCYGVVPVSDYLTGELAGARTPSGRLRVDGQLRVGGHPSVFAVGDVTDHLPAMAGFASRQADVVVATIRALIIGVEEPPAYQQMPPAIAVPIGPDGGAGQLPGQDAVVGPEMVSQLKGRTLMVERFRQVLGLDTPDTDASDVEKVATSQQ